MADSQVGQADPSRFCTCASALVAHVSTPRLASAGGLTTAGRTINGCDSNISSAVCVQMIRVEASRNQ